MIKQALDRAFQLAMHSVIRHRMNFLAHLHLAGSDPERIVGNLMADFVRGSDLEHFAPAIERGIREHRAIDAFTDAHPRFLESKRLISPARRRCSGIIVDLAFDHCLCRTWDQFCDVPLEEFVEGGYQVLEAHRDELPGKMVRMLPRMIRENWLVSYREVDGLARALDRLSQRSPRLGMLHGSAEEVRENVDALEEQFLAFYPELIAFVQQRR